MSTASANPEPFALRVGIGLAIVGALLMIGALALSGFGAELDRGFARDPGPAARGATGFKALHDIVASTPGMSVGIARDRDALIDPGLLILTPDRTVKPEEIGAIVRERDGRPTLIILPKWETQRDGLSATRERRVPGFDLGRARAVRLLGQVVEASLMPVRRDPIAPTSERGLPDFAPLAAPMTIGGPALDPLVDAAGAGMVAARVGDSGTFILADPDLANNWGLAERRNAVAMVALLHRMSGNGRVLFDVTLHYRPGERNLVKLMFTPPFVAVTIALIAAALLAGWAAVARFGPVAREARALPLGKTALLDTVTRLTRAAGRTHEGGARHADAVAEAIGRRLHAPAHLKGEALAAWIEARRPGFAERRRRLAQAASEDEMVAAARKLAAWRKEHA